MAGPLQAVQPSLNHNPRPAWQCKRTEDPGAWVKTSFSASGTHGIGRDKHERPACCHHATTCATAAAAPRIARDYPVQRTGAKLPTTTSEGRLINILLQMPAELTSGDDSTKMSVIVRKTRRRAPPFVIPPSPPAASRPRIEDVSECLLGFDCCLSANECGVRRVLLLL